MSGKSILYHIVYEPITCPTGVCPLTCLGWERLPGFGTFTVRKTKARKALNPRTGESVRVKAGKTVRFKASPVLKKTA